MRDRTRFKDLLQALREQGWLVTKTTKGHWKCVPPDPKKAIVVTAGTPSDHRQERNLLCDLKRQGFVVPPGF